MPIDLTPISGSSQLPSYQTLAEADGLAGEMPSAAVADYLAGSNAERDRWLKQATADIDAQKWQGSKYDLNQVLEFPRVPNPSFSPMTYPRDPYGISWPAYQSIGGEIWDWDRVNNVAIVPLKVKVAQIHQANSIAAGRGATLAPLHDGLASQGIGSLNESYFAGATPQKLCLEAFELLKRYELRSGAML